MVKLVKLNNEVGAGLDVDGVMMEVTITKDGICYELPMNPSNRKWVNIKRFVDSGVTELVLEYKAPRTINVSGPRKSDKDYMTDEERQIIAEIMEKCKERRLADKPQPKTDLEKAQAKLEKAQRELEALKAKYNN